MISFSPNCEIQEDVEEEEEDEEVEEEELASHSFLDDSSMIKVLGVENVLSGGA